MAVSSDIFRREFVIRDARPQDATALRMLLPQLRDGAEYLIAVERQSGFIVGAAGMTQSCRTQPFVGPGVAIEVIEPWRRHGVGSGLLAGLQTLAQCAFQANALYAAQRVKTETAEMAAWKWLEFVAIETVHEHVLPIDEFGSRLQPLFQKMLAKGRVPVGATIVPLYQANAGAVMQLHLDHMGGNRRELYQKLRGQGIGVYHPRYSRVLLIDGRVMGCVLAHRVDKHTARVDANIVDPSLRGGWANIWLKLESSEHALALGIRQFTFMSFDHYADTRSFSEKLGGTIASTTALMVRPFVPTTDQQQD